MDFQALADCFDSITGIISVEKTENGHGEIRIVAANDKYRERIATAPHSMHIPFVPDTPYLNYFPRNLNFEDHCYRAAVLKKAVHSYVHPNTKNWLTIVAAPLAYEEPDRCFCVFTVDESALRDLDLKSEQFVETSADVLKTCIKLHGTDDFEKTVKEIIRDIRVICDAAVCTVMLMDFNARTCNVLATDIKAGCTLKRATQFDNFYDIAASWIKTIGDSDCLIIKDEQDMQYISVVNNPWYLTLAEAGVKSVVMLPLRYNQDVLGYIWATNFDTRNVMRIKETLELTTFFLSSEISSYLLLKRLEHISYTDLLTGIRNRNAMNSRITEILNGSELTGESFGIIFADLNGLKEMNDTFGHAAGDLLLKKASILLQELFPPEDIYRAGGDEFMVIVPHCTEAEFSRKVRELRARAADPDRVCLAVGSCYAQSGSEIHRTMRLADEDMYQYKANFYELHPEQKQR